MTTIRIAQAAAGVLMIATVAACGGGGGDTDSSATTVAGGAASASTTAAAKAEATDKVEVSDFAFKPKDITVKAGTTVTWTFKDTATHTVASKSGESEIAESPSLKDGKTHTHAFTKAGTYAYRCTLHPQMTGSVVVTA